MINNKEEVFNLWEELFDNHTFIKQLYKKVPKLENVRMLSLEIKEEGRRVTISLEMPEYADYPPEKWILSKYNSVLLELDFFDVQQLSLSAKKSDLRGDVDVELIESDLLLINISGSLDLTMQANIGLIQSVTGYITSV